MSSKALIWLAAGVTAVFVALVSGQSPTHASAGVTPDPWVDGPLIGCPAVDPTSLCDEGVLIILGAMEAKASLLEAGVEEDPSAIFAITRSVGAAHHFTLPFAVGSTAINVMVSGELRWLLELNGVPGKVEAKGFVGIAPVGGAIIPASRIDFSHVRDTVGCADPAAPETCPPSFRSDTSTRTIKLDPGSYEMRASVTVKAEIGPELGCVLVDLCDEAISRAFLIAKLDDLGKNVGGIAELPEVAGTPLETDGSSGASTGVLAGVAGAVLVGGVTLGGAAWYARRRLIK